MTCTDNGGKVCDGNGKCVVCTSSSQCAGMGTYYACRQSKCVNLVTDLCTTVYTTKANPMTAYQDDNAVFFGSILPTAPPPNTDGPFGHLVEDSIKLAMDDFRTVDGIPGLNGAATRPLVLVGCNDGVNEDQTDVAAKHLVNEVGVPAIIGYAFSGNTISVAQDVTIPGNTLLFSPSATSAAITQLHMADKGLVWRTAPSDNVQAAALALYYNSVQNAAKMKYPNIAVDAVKVAIVHHDDAYGKGLALALQGQLVFNGKPATDSANGSFYTNIDYGPSQSPDLSVVQQIVSFAPHIIFLFSFNEGPDKIFTQVEQNWPVGGAMGDGHHPFWVFSDGGEVSSLWASSMMPMMAADITKDDQRGRVSGSVPGVDPAIYKPYNTFLTEFSSSYGLKDGSANTLGPAGAYDILYLLAYSTVMVGNNPLTGPNLVKYGLSQMQKTPGLPQIQIDPTQILSSFPKLTTGTPINVTGVSGPLLFDGKGDISTADIQFWCVPPSTPPSTDVGGSAINSGCYFNSSAVKLAGSFSSMCQLQGYTCP
jgi:branched-chain amino acid transport system substrate-binding protein